LARGRRQRKTQQRLDLLEREDDTRGVTMFEIGIQRQIPIADPRSRGQPWGNGQSFMHWRRPDPACPQPLVHRHPVCDGAAEPNPRRRTPQPSRGASDPTWSRIVHIASILRLPVMHSSSPCPPCDTSGMLQNPIRRRCPLERRQGEGKGSVRPAWWNCAGGARRGQLKTQVPPTATVRDPGAPRCSLVDSLLSGVAQTQKRAGQSRSIHSCSR